MLSLGLINCDRDAEHGEDHGSLKTHGHQELFSVGSRAKRASFTFEESGRYMEEHGKRIKEFVDSYNKPTSVKPKATPRPPPVDIVKNIWPQIQSAKYQNSQRQIYG